MIILIVCGFLVLHKKWIFSVIICLCISHSYDNVRSVYRWCTVNCAQMQVSARWNATGKRKRLASSFSNTAAHTSPQCLLRAKYTCVHAVHTFSLLHLHARHFSIIKLAGSFQHLRGTHFIGFCGVDYLFLTAYEHAQCHFILFGINVFSRM